MRVALVGLGLIGGSIALALRRLGRAVTTIGVERPEQVERVPAGVVDELVGVAEPAGLTAALAGAQLAVLCAPVRVISEQVCEALCGAAVVTDCGSTKRAIAARAAGCARRAWYVPGHPMAGAADGGLERARADLFQGRRWIVCPEGCESEAVERTAWLVRAVGAELVQMDIDDHDRAVALTSHLPQLLASALVVLAERRNAAAAMGPGFQSSTRVAGGPESMWLDIFLTNGDQVAKTLSELRELLADAEAGLGREPPEVGPVLELLRRARRARGG